MTSGLPIADERVLRALRNCPESTRDTGGGWHPSVVAENLDVTPETVQVRLRKLADAGDVVRVDGIGPTAPRTSYLPADHPDAPDDEDADDGRVWVA